MKLFVANWKMNFTTQQSLSFCQNNLEELKGLKNKLIVCPSAPALTVVSQVLKDTDVALCAQSCSENDTGSYTGQVSAKDLSQSGCTYVLVGHSEERKAFNLSNEAVAKKALRVLEAGMIPIVCIGESKEVYEKGNTISFLEEQLHPLKRLLKGASVYIAYEPLWVIGKDEIIANDELIKLFDSLKLFIQKCPFLYGGNVNEKTIIDLKKVDQICGFLIGRESLNFDSLYKIIM